MMDVDLVDCCIIASLNSRLVKAAAQEKGASKGAGRRAKRTRRTKQSAVSVVLRRMSMTLSLLPFALASE